MSNSNSELNKKIQNGTLEDSQPHTSNNFNPQNSKESVDTDLLNDLLKFLNFIIYISYNIVHFREIRNLNGQLVQEGKDSIYISMLKTSLSITFLLYLINENGVVILKKISLLINLTISEAIRFVLFKTISDFYVYPEMQKKFSVKNITIAFIISSLLYLIKYVYSKNYYWKKNMFSLYLKFFYIQFLIFYFLMMRSLNKRFELYQNLSDFKICFGCLVLFSILECIECLFYHINYQTFFSKCNFIIRIPIILFSSSKLIFYIFNIRNENEFHLREFKILYIFAFFLLIISTIQLIIDILPKKSEINNNSIEKTDQMHLNIPGFSNLDLKNVGYSINEKEFIINDDNEKKTISIVGKDNFNSTKKNFVSTLEHILDNGKIKYVITFNSTKIDFAKISIESISAELFKNIGNQWKCVDYCLYSNLKANLDDILRFLNLQIFILPSKNLLYEHQFIIGTKGNSQAKNCLNANIKTLIDSTNKILSSDSSGFSQQGKGNALEKTVPLE